MCGIAGIFSKKRLQEEREFYVRKMMDILAHRGPDGEGLMSSGDASFGHKRLSIIDIELGSQPMVSDDGRYVVVFNGEIYNYIELRQRLIQQGTRFKTFSDTEVLLKTIIHDGEKAFSLLNGMFAFAFYDTLTQEFIFCRDRVGIKPFYFWEGEGELHFASEIKALVKSGLVPAELNFKALYEYLTYQFCLGDRTLFKGINKIEPGHYVKGKGCKIEKVVKYWDTDFQVDQHHSQDYFEEQLLNLLYDSTRLQMRSDVPVGVYLSGGIDSAAVTVLAREIGGWSLSAFHGKFLESMAYDESRYAKIVANKTNSEWNEIIPTMDDFISEFSNLIYYLDEPVAGPGSFPQLLVSRLAATKVKVALGGQGGDELFCGYARYLIGYLEQALKGSIFQTREEGKHLVDLSSIIKSLPLLKEYVPLMKTFWQNGLFEDMDARYFNLIDRSPDMHKLLGTDIKNGFSKHELFEDFKQVFNHPKTLSYINKMTHFDLKTLLPSLLHVEDRVSMAASMESRVPLLDHRIIDLVTTMPPIIKFNEGQTKYIFKRALKNLIPSEILERKDKMGFPVPIKEWVKSDKFRSFSYDILGSQKCKERGILNPSALAGLIENDTNFGRQLWGALCLEMWFTIFIDND